MEVSLDLVIPVAQSPKRSAAIAAIGTTSCMGYGPVTFWTLQFHIKELTVKSPLSRINTGGSSDFHIPPLGPQGRLPRARIHNKENNFLSKKFGTFK